MERASERKNLEKLRQMARGQIRVSGQEGGFQMKDILEGEAEKVERVERERCFCGGLQKQRKVIPDAGKMEGKFTGVCLLNMTGSEDL